MTIFIHDVERYILALVGYVFSRIYIVDVSFTDNGVIIITIHSHRLAESDFVFLREALAKTELAKRFPTVRLNRWIFADNMLTLIFYYYPK